MASLKQFEAALKAKNVTPDRFIKNGKDIKVAYGYFLGQKYYWISSGICYAKCGSRCSRLDINFSIQKT